MEKIYNRICPICKKDLIYGSNEAYNLANRRNANCRSCSTKMYAKRQGNLNFLLNNENESYYWIGFILADGSFDKKTRLSITISEKDKSHLELFSIKSGTKVKDKISKLNNKEYKQVMVSILHTESARQILDKFNILLNKTINPPNIEYYENMEQEHLFSLFVGYIDGDGSIGKKHKRTDSHIRIKVHKNWIGFLDFFNKKLNINSPLKINNGGHALLQISNFQMCKKIKTEMLKLKIPFLKRKWDLIVLK